MGAIDFTSRIPRHRRQALERLLFFNGCQDRVARDIVDAIDRYGPPEIVDDGEGLRVRLVSMPEASSIFAVEPESGRVIGVAVYIRADQEHVTVVHLGVAEDYCSGGLHEAANLPLRLVREVKRTSRRIKGVRRLEVAYCTQRPRASTDAL
jgi:hypothetical protein